MFSTDDSIVAIATPPGRGGLGVVRLSGPSAVTIASSLTVLRFPLEPRHATFTRVRADIGAAFDEVVATFFKAPHSYTGQDVVEISAHGSPVVLQAIVRLAIDAGARLAQPGEFTLRAFLNGKRDLIQAEAIGDLIAAVTPRQARVAFDQLDGTLTRRIRAIDADLFDLIARLEASLDFPDEGYHFIEPAETARGIGSVIESLDGLLTDATGGRLIRDGVTVVISGRTNVGKSSIFNVLAGSDRAIVTEIPGTTRDLVTETVDISGLAVSLVDTAGSRDTLDVVEREGVRRGRRAVTVADLVLVVLDGSEPLTDDDRRLLAETAALRRIIVANKSDRGRRTAADEGGIEGLETIGMSTVTLEGVAELRGAILRSLSGLDALRDTPAMSNVRHISLVEQARERLLVARSAAATGGTPEEFVLTDLQAARARLEEIVGVRTSEDVLQHIFEHFCVGK